MALEYEISAQIMEGEKAEANKDKGNHKDTSHDPSHDGFAVIKKDSQGVGHFVRLAKAATDAAEAESQLKQGEMLLYYRIRHGQPKLATNAFFFQEGHAEAFEQAQYGLFRINEQGEPLLTDMVDADFKIIDPKDEND